MTSNARSSSAKASLGEFEHHVLLAALRLGDEAYTASILTELEERTGREVSAAAVYIALRRLERSGLMRSDMRTGPAAHEKRERRYVRVTARGLRLVRESRQRFDRLWDGLGDLATGKRR
jgi:DNA-binding PadR family transcriptional regulator